MSLGSNGVITLANGRAHEWPTLFHTEEGCVGDRLARSIRNDSTNGNDKILVIVVTTKGTLKNFTHAIPSIADSAKARALRQGFLLQATTDPECREAEWSKVAPMSISVAAVSGVNNRGFVGVALSSFDSTTEPHTIPR